MKPRPWTFPEQERLRELHSRGLSDKEIALEMGRSYHSISTKRRDLGLDTNVNHAWSDGEIAIVRRLMASGVNYCAASRTLNRTPESVRAMYRDLRDGRARGGRHKPEATQAANNLYTQIHLPSERVSSCDVLRDAIIASVKRYADERGMDLGTAATRLISMGVA